MCGSKMQNLTKCRNTVSKKSLMRLTKLRIAANLKQQMFLHGENKSETVFSTTINVGLPNFCDKKLKYSPNELKYQNPLTKFLNSSRTSAYLLTNHNRVLHSCTKPLGARHFSNEAAQQLPVTRLTGFWKDMSESAPVEFVQDSLISFQATTHLPWWATIILTTFIVRSTLTLPFSLYQHYIMAKVQNLHAEMTDAVEELKRQANLAVSHYSWTEFEARTAYNQAVKEKWDELIQRENCHPAKGFIVVWIQIPLWITISTALRNLCYMLPPNYTNAEQVFLELTTGGFGWVVNLIDVDHTCILPICVGIFNLTNVEMMSLLKTTKDTELQKYLLYFLRFVSIAMVPIAIYAPSCICLYWAGSSAFGLVQNLVLQSPKVRRLVGIPWTPTEKQNPYRLLFNNFKAKKYINFSRKSTNSK